jgi:hypothetical protein
VFTNAVHLDVKPAIRNCVQSRLCGNFPPSGDGTGKLRQSPFRGKDELVCSTHAGAKSSEMRCALDEDVLDGPADRAPGPTRHSSEEYQGNDSWRRDEKMHTFFGFIRISSSTAAGSSPPISHRPHPRSDPVRLGHSPGRGVNGSWPVEVQRGGNRDRAPE